MGTPEKDHSTKFSDKICDALGLWSYRFADTPYFSPVGMVNYKKPFDRIFVVNGVGAEFKFVRGKTFNIKRWKTKKKTRHQYIDLLGFHNGANRFSLLVYLWKRTGKRDIVLRYSYVTELEKVERVDLNTAHTEEELMVFLEKMKKG